MYTSMDIQVKSCRQKEYHIEDGVVKVTYSLRLVCLLVMAFTRGSKCEQDRSCTVTITA